MHEHEDIGKRGVWIDQHDNVWGVLHSASVLFTCVPAVESKLQTVCWPYCWSNYLSSLLFSMYHYVRMRPGRKLTSDMLGDFENSNVFQSRCLIRSNTHTGAP